MNWISNLINDNIKDLCRKTKITDYLQARGAILHRAGKKWKCLCPLHDDTNPSMWITEMPDGVEVYHCYACSKHGSIITLISELEGERKGVVIKKLALKNNVKLGKYDDSAKTEPLKDEILEFFCQEDEMILELADFMVPFLKRHGTPDVINKVSRVYEKIDKLSEIGDSEGILKLTEGLLRITKNYSGD